MEWMRAKLGTKKRVAVASVSVVLLALAGFWLWGDGASAAPYLTGRVERGSLRNTVTATGTLEAVTTVQVGSQASGTIAALYADFNSQVRKGQVIAQLDPAQAQAQVAQARANLEQAVAGLEQARAALVQARAGVGASRAGVTDARAKAAAAGSTAQNQRAGVASAEANVAVLKAQLDDAASVLKQEESLLRSGVISQREYETAQTNYRTAQARYQQSQAQLNQARLSEQSAASAGQAQAEAQVEQARSQVEQSQAQVGQSQAQVANAEAQVQQARAALQLAEVNLAHTTIRSPIDGVVVSRDVDVGQTVAASLSAPTLFTIAQDLTRMQVVANIDQADIGLVEQAKKATFTVDAFPGDEFEGTIQQLRLNPVSAQNVVTYNVVFDVANPGQKLKPGMTANLTITIDERRDVLKIPNAALRFTPQLTEEQRAARRAQAGRQQGRARRQSEDAGGAENAAQPEGRRGGEVAPPTAPVLEGQTRRVWVLGPEGQPRPRRIKIGLTDGASTEVVEGELREGDVVITGQNVTAQQGTQRQGGQQAAPGFGGAPRMGGGGGRR
ncbi:MAG TPA: efflux RND transporter periplasmic adaptor subunit [Pyrinomonadaceae bacterium]|nr:efflux RND transporter periplasmic adaptor subunit [Pyrinomonadaceae bacterium]